MTKNQVVDLLTAISAYDNRKPNQAAIIAWGTAAEMGRWTLPEALAAVKAHFFESTEYLMPAHLAKRIRETRQDRALREEVAAIEAGPVFPEEQAKIQKAIQELADGMGWDREDRAAKFAYRVPCPHCRVPIGRKCVNPKTGEALRSTPCHPARADALAAELRGEAS